MATVRIHTLGLGIARAYLLQGPATCVLVDSGYPGTDLEARLGALGPGTPPVAACLLTHAHVDHFGGLPPFLALHPGLPLACGQADAGGLAAGINVDLSPLGLKGRLFALASKGARPLPSCPATRILEDGASLEEWGLEARLVATPGHTRGSFSVFVPEAVDARGRALGPTAIAGDLVMGGFVLHALPGPPIFASGWEELRASMGKLKDLGVETILPGHGGPLSAARVYKRYQV